MAKFSQKNMFHLNQIKLRNTHKISGDKTILKFEKSYQRFLKKAIVLPTNKLEKFKDNSDIITKVIAETIVKIFELPLEGLTGNKF